MIKTYRWLLLALFLLGSMAHAENGCPQGMIPASGNDINSCVPVPPGYYGNQQQAQPQQQTQPQPAPQWASRWGAIATDGPGGHLGVAADLTSKDEAMQIAVADCQNKGGANCKIETWYSNGCAAMVVGDGGHNSTNAVTLDKAIQIGMSTCRSSGDTNCHAYYSACSLPKQVL